ncbi:MAG: cobyrinate a,c-diamide synthase [Chloroflexi bacterium]|nr:cobyrinate a,c-diamide synthase [Chloroflexota bacterium]MBI2979991.1 cobyrinate a,c-diamide synthase [Chloroflexota bacterium]
MKAIVIAGTVSGVGKTTIATGLMGALSRRKLKVQPFKAGPDYIDPTYHTWATGVPSRNLDTWMLPHQAVVELFNRAMIDKDIAIIEGVMGLYDGRSSTSDEASTAEMAKLIRVPVLLVVDSRKTARSLAAMVTGYQTFDPALRIGGIILNGIGSDGHLKLCQEAIEHYTGIKVMGYLPRRDNLSLPERHLGLIPTVENPASEEFLGQLIAQCEATFNIPEILRLAEQAMVPAVKPALFPPVNKPPVVSIAVAKDKAFSFYYQDSLDLLEAWGAELIPFSPLQDTQLPPGVSGVYIGGGFPEMYAADLTGNKSMRQAMSSAARRGMPIYAECGGLMYLGRSIRDLEGNEYPMVGAIPISSRIDTPRLSLGYRTIQALADGPLLRQGEIAHGHEFHWSVLQGTADAPAAYKVIEKTERTEGFQQGNLLASYIHLHLGGLPFMASRLVNFCLAGSGK